jgi:hypothetical protein
LSPRNKELSFGLFNNGLNLVNGLEWHSFPLATLKAGMLRLLGIKERAEKLHGGL